MAKYKIITLVDITRSYATRNETDPIKIGQQSNFNSLIQAIGMRSNVFWKKDPLKMQGRLPRPFQGKGNYWEWDFEVEQEEVFQKNNDPVGLLLEDLQGVPIIDNLENSENFSPMIFSTNNINFNIHVEVI